MGGPELIVTERLRGERLGPHHADVLYPIYSDPRVGATMGGVADRASVEHLAQVMATHWEQHGFGYMMWFELATGEPVARGGLARTTFDSQPELEARVSPQSSARPASTSPSARWRRPISSRSRSRITVRPAGSWRSLASHTRKPLRTRPSAITFSIAL
jgi:hypothetical protein